MVHTVAFTAQRGDLNSQFSCIVQTCHDLGTKKISKFFVETCWNGFNTLKNELNFTDHFKGRNKDNPMLVSFIKRH